MSSTLPNPWPFITLRQTRSFADQPALLEKIIGILAAHPGAADEIWLYSGCPYGTPDAVRHGLRNGEFARELCHGNGIQCSYQQGVTLGHGQGKETEFMQPREGIYWFEEEDFMVDEKGNRLWGQLCPRSPRVQQSAYDYARAVLEALRPDSYWPDDDLRQGVSKPYECFCDRCMADFNRQNGTAYTREELAAKLFGPAVIEPLREKWAQFHAESLALYGAQTRRAVEDVHPACRIGYQAVWANAFYPATNYKALLEAFSGPRHCQVGIRPGAGCYTDSEPRKFVFKALNIAREAARCKRYGFIGQIAYEQENYRRKNLHKSPEAMMIESTLALASGCDSLTEYWYDPAMHEPLDALDDYAAEVVRWRPYLEDVAASTKRTRLGGVARYLGSRAYMHSSWTLNDENDQWLAEAGIPVTVQEDEPDAVYLTPKSVECMTEADLEDVFSRPLLIPADVLDQLLAAFPERLTKLIKGIEKLPQLLKDALANARSYTVDAQGGVQFKALPLDTDIPAEDHQYGLVSACGLNGARFAVVGWFWQVPPAYCRQSILDALDAVAVNSMPVRLNTCNAVRVLPRILQNGTLDSVTLLNLSIGRTRELDLVVRNAPDGEPVLLRPGEEPLALHAEKVPAGGVRVTVPRIPGWQPVTLSWSHVAE